MYFASTPVAREIQRDPDFEMTDSLWAAFLNRGDGSKSVSDPTVQEWDGDKWISANATANDPNGLTSR